MNYRIECVNHDARHERIVEIGGTDDAGKEFRFSEATAITMIENRTAEFYVERPSGHRAAVFVERSREGHKFLKTVPDGELPDNLSSLPACEKPVRPTPPPTVVTPARSHCFSGWRDVRR